MVETNIRRRRIIITVVSILLILVAITFVEVYTRNIKASSPIANYIIFYSFYNINFILLLILFFLVIRNLVKLYFERQRKVPGAKFRTKLIVSFFLLTIIPSVLLFLFARVLISQTIEYWFSLPIENSLSVALEVSESYYKNLESRALHFSWQMSKEVSEKNLIRKSRIDNLKNLVNEKRKEYNLSSISIYSTNKKELVKILDPKFPENRFKKPGEKFLRRAFRGKKITEIKPVGKGELIIGITPIKAHGDKTHIIGAVATSFYLPKGISEDIKSINLAYKEYREKNILKRPIANNYIAMFAIVTILIIFAAMWFGLQMAKGITGPIQQLAEGTKEIAGGNLDFHIDLEPDPESQDEIGVLVSSFNQMTDRLKKNKADLEEKNISLKNTNIELEQKRTYMETVLENITTGVISLDNNGNISTINKAAENMLHANENDTMNKHYTEVFGIKHFETLKKIISQILDDNARSLEKEINLNIDGEVFIFMTNINMLFDSQENYLGMVIVLDNLTELIRAQRVAAWREVARRIAHEIKNPLTPIKLSAQRLKKKFQSKAEDMGEVLEDCTNTIIQEVDDIKKMVNEFSQFARMPTSSPLPTNLHDIINEAIALYRGTLKDITIETEFSEKVPLLHLDPEQIKRVFINLLENAIEAMKGHGGIFIKTKYVSDFQIVKIEVSDTGIGIPFYLREKLFMPYFSTKKQGTGLGLAIVNTIISEHNGYIRVKDNEPQGTTFVIELPAR